MKPRFQLQAPDGRLASYDMRTGPFLTDNFQRSYIFDSRQEAEQQRPLYQQALNTTLTIIQIP